MITGIVYLAYVLILAYAVLIILILSKWKPSSSPINSIDQRPKISIIVAARNEERTIKPLIDSILANAYPEDKLEILVVDDHSTDSTADIVDKYPSDCVHLLALSDVTAVGSKKQAIAYAGSIASGDIWMYTDGDCQVPSTWISQCISTFQSNQNTQVVLGTITYRRQSTWLGQWQQLDLMGMMAVTKAGIELRQWFIANGANLAIRSQLWNQVGYDLDTDHVYASGDDVTLVQKASILDPYAITYNLHSDYIVTTAIQPSYSDLLQQRIRWTSKNGMQSSLSQKFVMVTTFLTCLMIYTSIIASIWMPSMLIHLLSLLGFKTIIDTLYLRIIQEFFKSQIRTIRMIILSPLHTLYVTIFGILAIFPQQYQWKGRRVR